MPLITRYRARQPAVYFSNDRLSKTKIPVSELFDRFVKGEVALDSKVWTKGMAAWDTLRHARQDPQSAFAVAAEWS